MNTYKIDANKQVKCDEFVLLELDSPIQNLERLTSIKALGNCASNIVIEYRYSRDGNIWSEWVTWNEWNLEPSELTWFGFRVKSDTTWYFESLQIEWNGGDLLGECNCSIIKYSEDSFIVPCGSNQQVEYSGAMAFVNTWEKMANEVFKRYGWSVIYFKCDPVQESKDVVFKEWSLLEVRECKQLKVVIPDNDFGSGNFQFTEFDIDFADDLKFQISKESFWTAFGRLEQPGEKDFLYFPIEGRMFRINSVQESKEFMRQSKWWEGTMIKWNESDSILKNQEIQTTIDELTLDFEDVGFELEREIEEENITKEQQYVIRPIAKNDKVRESVYIDWEQDGVVEENLNNYFTVFSRYHYNLSYPGATNTTLITYQDTIDLDDNLSLMFWYNGQTRDVKNDNVWRNLFTGGVDVDILISVDSITKIRINNKVFTVNVPINDWFAYYIGFNRVDNTLTLRIWERADINKKTTKMGVFFECVDNIPSDITGEWKPQLVNSGDLITSIRFLKAPVTLENQSVLFTKLVFPDDYYSYIIDDAYPIMFMEQFDSPR